MEHADHVGLLRDGVVPSLGPTPGHWADIGAGDGAFTLALADLLGAGARIVALDRDAGALARNAATMQARFPAVRLQTELADLERPPAIGPLDGLVAANSLHFVPSDRQVAAVARLAALLRPGGAVIVVEYDADQGNRWVPYPFSAARWPSLATAAGLAHPRVLATVPSRFLGAIYAAVATRP